MKTDLFFNRLGFNPDLTTRQSRVDSVSIASRYRVLATLLLCLTLFVGSGNAWGETITLTQSALELTGSYTTNTVKTVSNVDFTYTDLMKNNSNIQAKASSGKIYNSSLVPGKITKVQITSTGTGRSTTIAMGTSTSNYTAGTYTGNGGIYLNGPANTCCGYFKITRGSNAAYWTQVVITYTPATITLSKSSISGLDYAVGGGPSAAQTFTVSGSNIPANLTVTAPTNFEVSLDGSSWASSKTINVTLTGSASAGTLSSTTIYVRLASGKSAGNYSGNVSIAMAGCKTISSVNPKTVAVSGTVSAASYTVGWSITDGGGTLSTTSGMSTTVTPASGYRYASPAYTILTGSATVVQSSNTFSATPTDNSTIRINMEQIPSHNIIFNTGGLVTIPSASVLEGATYDITEDPSASLSDDCEYNTFVGWTMASSIADPSVKPSLVTSVTMSTSDVTLYAVYSKTEGSGGGETYDKVTSTDDIEDGQYLVVCESQSVAFNGGLSTLDASSNTISVDISSNQIAVSSTTEDAEFTIDATNQTIQSASGYYIDRTSGTSGGALHTTTSNPQSHTFSIDNSGNFVDQASVTGTHSYLKYNANSGQERFRYYVTGQTDIQLYKKSSGTTTYSLNPSCDGPTITVSTTEIDFEDQKVGESYERTFTVSGTNLTADIELEIIGIDHNLFSIDQTTLEVDDGSVATTTITVTWTPSAAYNQTHIHINSTGATERIVHLEGWGKWEVEWRNNGGLHRKTLVKSGEKPTFPPTPESCDDESTDFVGWTTAGWSGKIDDVSEKTIYTNYTDMPTVSANGTIYHAVFAQGEFEEGPAVGTTIYAEDFSGFSGDADPSGTYTNSHAGTTLYSGSVTYSKTNGSGTTQTKSESLAGGSSPELMVAKYSGTFTVAGIPRCGAAELTLTYKQNGNSLTSSVSGTGYSGGKGTSTSGTTSTDIICGSGSTFNLTFTGPIGNSNVRLDDILITVKRKAGTYVQYLTNCCDKNVTLAHNSPSNGTVTFSPAGPIATCSATAADRQTTVTVTPAAGYKLTGWVKTYTTLLASEVDSTGTISTSSGNASAQSNTYTFTQNKGGTMTVTATFTAMVDTYKDQLHGDVNTTFNGDGKEYSATYTVPGLSEPSKGSECKGEHYKFVGWVESSYVKSDGTLNTGYEIHQPGASGTASEKTYVAIWAKEL